MEKSLKIEKLSLGVCYYPEHWPESLWEDDLRRMLEVGIETVRIAEFAWNKFEPEEGRFTFDFFDRFLEKAVKAGMKVIFCTPTATPPAWVSHNYPEILNVSKEGLVFRHGLRRHYNYNSPKYRQLTADIVEQLAKHYSRYDCIIGWQIDNEINCECNEFYSDSDDKAFRVFLQNKYSSLEELNKAWGTVFWNQDYTDWAQVQLPRPTYCHRANQHQELDYIRFISESASGYVKLQADIIRKHIKDNVYITTNGLFGRLDNHKMTNECLDFIMYDSYPNFAFDMNSDPKNSKDLNDRKWSRSLAEVRSISPNFGIMEQQSGPGGWTSKMEAPSPKPGQLTLWTMQSIAHGADFISYFRWRTCTVGTEIYWHGILDYDNRDNRRLAEVGQVNKLLEKAGELAGSSYRASFAVLRDYDNIWDAEYDNWHSRLERQSYQAWFAAGQINHCPMDYLYISESTELSEMSRYPLLVYPHPAIVRPETALLLKAYVENGGILILGCRSGYKNEHGHCLMLPKPGLLAELAGCDVADFTFRGPGDDEQAVIWNNNMLEAPVFSDILNVNDGKELAVFSNDYYKGKTALVEKQSGSGKTYYFGSAFSEQNASFFLKMLSMDEPYKEYLELPFDCELAVREKGGSKYFFVLNYMPEPRKIRLNKEFYDVFKQDTAQGEIELPPYGTSIYKI